jgi:ribose-phosphate pyrophosphokinase
MLLFSLDQANRAFAEALGRELDITLAPHEERSFEDGERKLRPLVDPRGEDVYVLLGLHGDREESPHDKLLKLWMFIATLRDHGARRVTAVVPYLAYARKDRRTKPYDPLGLRVVAQLFESVGTAQIIVLEVHNPAALENAFRIPAVHLESRHALQSAVLGSLGSGLLAIASPDPGGVKRAQLWREDLEHALRRPVGFALVDKRRSAGLLGGGDLVAGSVDGATVVLFDDLISSGETLRRAASALRRAGAARLIACAAHGLFKGEAADILANAGLDEVIVTDSVPAFRLPAGHRVPLQVTTCVPILAQALRDSHTSWTA